MMPNTKAMIEALPERFSWKAWPVQSMRKPSGRTSRGGFLECADRLTGAVSGGRVAEHLGGDEAVESLDHFGPDDRLDADHRRQRNHRTRCRAHIGLAQILGTHAIAGIGLQFDLVGLARAVEVVDVERAHGRLQRRVDRIQRDAEGQCLRLVHFDEELRRGYAEEAVDAREFRPLAQGLDQLRRHLRQVTGIGVGTVLQVDLEAACRAQPLDGRRVEHQRHALGQLHADTGELLRQHVGRFGPLLPRLEDDEGGGDARAVVAGDEVDTAHEEDVLDDVAGDRFAEALDRCAGALARGAVGQREEAEQVALVLGRNEAARHDADQHAPPRRRPVRRPSCR